MISKKNLICQNLTYASFGGVGSQMFPGGLQHCPRGVDSQFVLGPLGSL